MDDLDAWALRMREHADEASDNIQTGRTKWDSELCEACPRLDDGLRHKLYEDDELPCHRLPLGHHPNYRCPDGFVEKILPQEIPGVNYRQSKRALYGPRQNSVDYDISKAQARKSKICFYCLIEVLRGARRNVTETMTRGKYWLCKHHVGKFTAWRKKNKDKIESGRNSVYVVYKRE